MSRFQTQLSAELPDGWSFREEITLVTAAGDANVLASNRPLDGPADVKSYAEELGQELEQGFAGYRELALEEIVLPGGRNGWVRRFETEPEPGRRITQIQTYDVRGDRVYLATATAASSDFARCEQELLAVLSSIDIDPRAGI